MSLAFRNRRVDATNVVQKQSRGGDLDFLAHLERLTKEASNLRERTSSPVPRSDYSYHRRHSVASKAGGVDLERHNCGKEPCRKSNFEAASREHKNELSMRVRMRNKSPVTTRKGEIQYDLRRESSIEPRLAVQPISQSQDAALVRTLEKSMQKKKKKKKEKEKKHRKKKMNEEHDKLASGVPEELHAADLEWIHIAPGLSLPLLGSVETIQALNEKRIDRQSCLACEADIACSNRAHYILCPQCRCINPIFTAEAKGGPACVGLGFVYQATMHDDDLLSESTSLASRARCPAA